MFAIHSWRLQDGCCYFLKIAGCLLLFLGNCWMAAGGCTGDTVLATGNGKGKRK